MNFISFSVFFHSFISDKKPEICPLSPYVSAGRPWLGTRAEANLSIHLEGIFNGEDTQLGRNNSVEKSPIEDRPFTCLVCDKNFNNCTNWKTHLKIHSEEQLFKCLHCPNSSTSTPEKRLPFQFTQLKTQIVNVVKKGAQKIKV